MNKYGQALAQETKAKGRNVILGPCVNIHRTPYAGRNFESFGEDAFLAAAITDPYIRLNPAVLLYIFLLEFIKNICNFFCGIGRV
ncbi:MAG: glycoside hydrolase family 3 N-terminal domain-containing protein [candidate division KSB1 bacterium]|nr:glycoside hydrolase family 3 N-terminal domain-containing protein [candidate division KSB1 bacterium]